MVKHPSKMSRDELEEEVHYLRGQASAQVHDERLGCLMADYNLTPNEARLALGMFISNRPVTRERVLAITLPQDRAKELSYKLPDVVVHRVRTKLGKAALITHVGIGWSLSEEGRRLLAACFDFHTTEAGT